MESTPGRAAFLWPLAACFLCFMAHAGEKVRLEFWHVGNYDDVTVMRELAGQFEAKTGIAVHVQPLPWGDFNTKYLTALAASAPPDAGSTNLSGAMEYGKVGGLVDLGATFPEAIQRLKDETFPKMWPICSFRGQLLGVPLDAAALTGFYRKDIFESLGLKPPETWGELEHVLDAVTSHGYEYGFLWTRNAHWGMGTFTWPFGQDSFADDGRKVNWTNPDFLKGYRFAIDLWNGYNSYWDKAVEIFSIEDPAKASPLFFDYHTRYTELTTRAPKIRDKIGVFPFPRPEGGSAATMMGGRTAVIFRKGKHPAEAMQWLEFILSKESQLFLYRALGNRGERSALALSVNRSFWDEDLGLPSGCQDVLRDVYERMNTREAYPWLNEACLPLERSMYEMQESLQQFFQKEAGKRRMSVFDLKKEIAAGRLPDVRAAYREFLDTKSLEVLTRLGNGAQQKLDQDYAAYEQQFGGPMANPDAVAAAWDVLDLAEWGMAAAVILAIGYIFSRRTTRACWHSYCFVAPVVLSALLFTFVPILVALYLSFTKYTPLVPLSQAHWAGLDNYIQVLRDRELWQSLGRSYYFALLALPAQIAVGVVLAACLDKNLWPDRLVKFLFFSPMVTSAVSVSLIWFALYMSTQYGWINGLLLGLDLIRDPINFLRDKRCFLNCVIVMAVWQGLAFTVLIFLAGLQNVPKALYEAASIDGAGVLRQFFHISLPGLRPQFAFLVTMGTIGAVQVFEQIYMLGGGTGEAESKFGPDDCGMTIAPLIYRKGFELFKMGEACAIAFILFLLLLSITYVNLRMTVRKVAQ